MLISLFNVMQGRKSTRKVSALPKDHFAIFLIAPVLTWYNMPELLCLALAIMVVRVQSGSLAAGALLI